MRLIDGVRRRHTNARDGLKNFVLLDFNSVFTDDVNRGRSPLTSSTTFERRQRRSHAVEGGRRRLTAYRTQTLIRTVQPTSATWFSLSLLLLTVMSSVLHVPNVRRTKNSYET